MVDYSSESMYHGGDSSFEPGDTSDEFSNYTGFSNLKGAQIGFPGSPFTGNQLSETINAIKQGTKVFEVTMLGPAMKDADQAIPTQHFHEIRALMKLTGVKPSLHGPLMDAAGFGQGGWGGEQERSNNERRMFDAIEKAHILDPQDNLPVVFHTGNSGGYSSGYVPDKSDKDDKTKDKLVELPVINLETKQALKPLEIKHKFHAHSPKSLKENKGKGSIWTLKGQLNSMNGGEWENSMTELATFSKHAEEIIGDSPIYFKKQSKINEDGKLVSSGPNWENAEIKGGKLYDRETNEELPGLTSQQNQSHERIHDADIFLKNVQLHFDTMFHKAYKYGTDEQKKELKKLSKDYSKDMDKLIRKEDGTLGKGHLLLSPIHKKEALGKAINKLRLLTSGDLGEEYDAPQVYVNATDFAMKKATKTFGNLAIESYKKFGETAPTLAIENIFEGLGFSRAEDHIKLIKDSRKRFVKHLVNEEGVNEKQAKKIAKDRIGATWDMGHINMAKSKGFGDEYVEEQTKKIAKYVKHVHVTDNFGFSDSHLAPGMGNVPIKKVLEQLEKHGEIDKMKMIVEAGGFVEHMKKSPHPFSLTAFGSRISGGGTDGTSPAWNEALATHGHYFGGYGTTNPEVHHGLYGSGFTTMPLEFGGQMPGNQSRFGGAPMA